MCLLFSSSQSNSIPLASPYIVSQRIYVQDWLPPALRARQTWGKCNAVCPLLICPLLIPFDLNSAFDTKDRYEDYFVHDVLADAESRFPVLPGRENRAVVGVSMGGFAAVRLAFTHPDLFVFAGAISPAIDVPSRHFSWSRWSQSMRFRNIFGPTGSETRTHSDPFILVKTAESANTPYLYISAGEQEPLLSPIRRFVTLLKLHHYAHNFPHCARRPRLE
jgi:pimeloyl-ACP methyl ester carboxylesterase